MSDRNLRKVSASGGLLTHNPLLGAGLGVCVAVTCTATAAQGLTMGAAVGCVLVCLSILDALLGRNLSRQGRLFLLLMLGAALASIAQIVMKLALPGIALELDACVPLMAVAGAVICLEGNEGAERSPGRALAFGLGTGVAYAVVLTLIGILRELLGSGSVFGAGVFSAGFQPMLALALPAGGFLTVGIAMGIYRAVTRKVSRREEETPV